MVCLSANKMKGWIKGMMKKISIGGTKPGIVAACGLAALAVVTLCLVNQSQAQARGYVIGSEDALQASLFDPFLLTSIQASAPVGGEAPPPAAPAPALTPFDFGAGANIYVPPIRVPYRPPLRSPSRPPLW